MTTGEPRHDDVQEVPDPSLNATFCATLVDEWIRLGVRHAVVAPGSRSTPLAVAVAERRELSVSVQPDERSAAFMALGIGRATGVPALVITTSGTAAVELHPAVVEADLSCVPLLALTADRPPELQGVGAPQTIDQRELFGVSARWFTAPGPPAWEQRAEWRRIARDAFLATRGVVPGPVHCNLAFREPLLGEVGELVEPLEDQASVPADPSVPDTEVDQLLDRCRGQRGVIVAGGRSATSAAEAASINALAEALDWPILADHLSGCRGVPRAIERFDPLLRSAELAAAFTPAVVIRIGGLVASRVTNEWLDTSGAIQIGIDRFGVIPDPAHVLHLRIHARPATVADAAVGTLRRGDTQTLGSWWGRWSAVDEAVAAATDQAIRRAAVVSEPGVIRAALMAVPQHGNFVVSSSMPIRDLEWFVGARDGVEVVANRGANGIDGVVSSAVGAALAGRPTVAVVGDLAFLHDTNSLIGLARRDVNVAIVVIDNDGGGIFSFLPQAQALPRERFEQLFGTPHGARLATLASAHGVSSVEVGTLAGVESALVQWRDRGGPQVIVVRSSRSDNVAVHQAAFAAAAAAVDAVMASW